MNLTGYATIDTSGGNITLSGSLSGAGGLTVVGDNGNALFLNGTSDFSADLLVAQGGSLVMGGSSRLQPAIEYVGGSGPGAFGQAGGVNSPGSLFLGFNPASSIPGTGTYSLSGSGLLTATTEQFGGVNSSFLQTGGTNSVAYLDLGSGYYL